MRYSIILATFSVFLSSLFYNCSRSISSKTASQEIIPEKYPNDDSELALLMREMDKDLMMIRNAIQTQQVLPDIREKFAKIHTAQHTDSTTQNKIFQTMANNFLHSVDNFYPAQGALPKKFNLMVKNCLSCHQAYCPGPIIRIQRLLMEEK